MKELFTNIKNAIADGQRVVLASILASHGSTPRGQGARMAVFANGKTMGTVGGGMVEHNATLLAMDVLETGKSQIQSFALRAGDIADIGMVCGGDVLICLQVLSNIGIVEQILTALDTEEDSFLVTTVENESVTDFYVTTAPPEPQKGRVYVEQLRTAGRVFIFGGGHVSRALAPVLFKIQFAVTVLEDREQFVNRELFPTANDVRLVDFADFSKQFTLSEHDYAVIMTRGHQSDFDVLRQVLLSKASYIGCIGSRAKVAYTQQRLLELGFTYSELERIHSPIGIAIGAQTPEEIAISIAAELIEHRAKNR